MNMDIRKYIINNFENNSKKDIQKAIEMSLKEKDDITLPGMGVMFEILWENSNDNEKEYILNILENKFKK